MKQAAAAMLKNDLPRAHALLEAHRALGQRLAPGRVLALQRGADIAHENGWSSASYRDPATGLEVQVRADEQFREWVLFTQPNRPSLCIEPYSGLPNAINMPAEGLGDGGLSVLQPGQRWRAVVVVACDV